MFCTPSTDGGMQLTTVLIPSISLLSGLLRTVTDAHKYDQAVRPWHPDFTSHLDFIFPNSPLLHREGCIMQPRCTELWSFHTGTRSVSCLPAKAMHVGVTAVSSHAARTNTPCSNGNRALFNHQAGSSENGGFPNPGR